MRAATRLRCHHHQGPRHRLRNEAIIRGSSGTAEDGLLDGGAPQLAHLMKVQERGLPAPMAFAIGLHPGYEDPRQLQRPARGVRRVEMGAGVLGETLELVSAGDDRPRGPGAGRDRHRGRRTAGRGEPRAVRRVHRLSKGRSRRRCFEVTAITRAGTRSIATCRRPSSTDHQPLVSVPMRQASTGAQRNPRPHRSTTSTSRRGHCSVCSCR